MTDVKTLAPLDQLISDENIAALTRRTYVEPVEGSDAVIFPPTYPIEQDKTGYNIDEITIAEESNGQRQRRVIKVCQIDSVGSQANRIEPLFAMPSYDALVPQVVIEAGDHRVNLLEAGHRAADAVVRCSSLGPQLDEAMTAIKRKGDATPLAKLAPTSLVFGFWDSRETQVKMPRVVRSVIRAFDVDVLRRSAQYSTTAGVILDGENVEVTAKGKKAERGFAHVPAVHAHGGILVHGEIRRDAILNLSALRSIRGGDADATVVLQRYILGLALVAFTADQPVALREGCELIPRSDSNASASAATMLVSADGKRAALDLTAAAALEFAESAAKAFGVGKGGVYPFDRKIAEADLKKGK